MQAGGSRVPHVMPYMRKERPSRKEGWSGWKQLLNISNLPRNVTAWLRMRSRNGIGKSWKRWLKFGESWRETLRPRTLKSSAPRPLLHFHRPYSLRPNGATPGPCARAPRARVGSRTCPPFPCIPEQTADIAQTWTLCRNSPVTLAATPKCFRKFLQILSSILKSRQMSEDKCLRVRAATCD